MFEWISDPHSWIALSTLTALEIVLGVDNIIFLTIIVGRLPESQRQHARIYGLSLAMVTRILLLLSIVWVMKLTYPLFNLFNHPVSGKDLILIGGGLFLLAKSTHEIHTSLDHNGTSHEIPNIKFKGTQFFNILLQIAVIDIIFSLDSVITAVGLVDNVSIMIIAIIIAVTIMMFSAKHIGDFVDKHPTIKMLALSFLILVGTTLIAEGAGFHVPKGYIYFAMAYSVLVELLNIKIRKNLKS